MLSILSCPLCSSRNVSLIHKGVRDNPDIDVYACENCSIKFLSKFNNNDYEAGFMHLSTDKAKLSPEEHLNLCEEDDERRYQMTQKECRSKKVLDFGCGFGGYLSRIQSVSDYCAGVELGNEEKVYLNSKGITCKRDIDEYEESFDVVTLFHVLEHLENPKLWLEKIASHVKEGGRLIIEVPNANDALLTLYKNKAFADFTYWSAHLILYTEETLKRLILSTGKFRPVKLDFYQRYPLSNHLYWLAYGKPGGHIFKLFNDPVLSKAYSRVLKEEKLSDTIYQIWERI